MSPITRIKKKKTYNMVNCIHNFLFIRKRKQSRLKLCVIHCISYITHIEFSWRTKKTLPFSRRVVRYQNSTILHLLRMISFFLYYWNLPSECLKRKIISWGLQKHLFWVCLSTHNKLKVKWNSLAKSVQWQIQCFSR